MIVVGVSAQQEKVGVPSKIYALKFQAAVLAMTPAECVLALSLAPPGVQRPMHAPQSQQSVLTITTPAETVSALLPDSPGVLHQDHV